MKTSKSISAAIVCLFVATAIFIASAARAQDYQEGVDYITLSGDATVLPDGKVEVLEFFWFGCPSCFRFEPYLLAWQKPETIRLANVPAVWNRNTEFHAHVYYAMELLNLNGDLMQPFYDELHVRGSRIYSVEDFEAWASTQPGVDAGVLASSVHSFGTITKVSQAELLADTYGVTGVPTLVVAGKYRTSPSMAGSSTRVLEIVEYLANRVLAAQ